jgi:hypothetical protein
MMDDNSTNTQPAGYTPVHSNDNRRSGDLRKVCDEQDRAREALKRKLGIVEVAVDLVREARDE